MTAIPRQPTLAAFDFDGTLTRGESFFRFLAFVTPAPRFAWCFLLSLPVLLQYVSGVMANEPAKVRVLEIFLRGRRLDDLQPLAVRFAREKIPGTLRPEAIARLHGHQKQGHVCVLVSATLALYLKPWAEEMGFEAVLATELAVDAEGRLTGGLATPNCYGPEKAARLRAAYGVERIHAAYGDSAGDREMLAMADKPGYRVWN